MMRVLYYDCFCGISGDMNVAALLDLGVEEQYLRQELAKLQLPEAYELVVRRGLKQGISGTQVEVMLHCAGDQSHDHGAATGHHHADHHHHHHHAHAAPEHSHASGHHSHKAHAPHRNLADIQAIIEQSELSAAVKARSLAIFQEVAEAEAKVHGKALHEVHFHEVGATDSIVDIVAAAICLEYLAVDAVWASPVQLGGGFVRCAHGLMPVPAPATAEILRAVPVKTGLVEFETTTPTGAAVLKATVEQFTDTSALQIQKVGYGLGHRDLVIPNVLRVYLAEAAMPLERTGQYILETNIDDMNPEFYGHVEERLLAHGALDVFKTPISMKKGRMATKLSVLVAPESEEAVLAVLFAETTSLGVRKYPVEKIMLPRQLRQVVTPYGTVTVKDAYYQGQRVKSKPEYEECRALALVHQVSLETIYQAVRQADKEAENGEA